MAIGAAMHVNSSAKHRRICSHELQRNGEQLTWFIARKKRTLTLAWSNFYAVARGRDLRRYWGI